MTLQAHGDTHTHTYAHCACARAHTHTHAHTHAHTHTHMHKVPYTIMHTQLFVWQSLNCVLGGFGMMVEPASLVGLHLQALE